MRKDESTSCTHVGCADGDTVAVFRERLHAWLDSTVDLDEQRICDIVLATNEALTNTADHAYRASRTSGRVPLHLSYDADESTVTVRVNDEGRWLEPQAVAANSIRGRGLTLMKALADSCSVDGRADGTAVTLIFRDCPTYENLASRLG